MIDGAHIDAVARAVHESYVAEQVSRGANRNARECIVAWDELPEYLKDASRAQVRGYGDSLRTVGVSIVLGAAPQGFSFTPEEVEVLARREHDRWIAHWSQQGGVREPDRLHAQQKKHLFVAYEDLSEAERQKDRDVFVRLPAILRQLGMGLVRVG